ncbi:MAG TPA: tRNA uracil 4-sulfurtransferase ThiI, partial [Longimicrobiaceae bacterium]|nr:tRNA uracil 4-sulfurtransferase ThiI [Longimicrobiaceae bacterium]
FVRTTAPEAMEILARIPGISSLSRVEAKCRAELPVIVERGREIFADRVVGRTYAVRARRAGTHPFSSYDVQRELGAALNPGARVDLSNPEVEVEVEIRDDWAYFFSGRVDGLGGLPLGVEGRAICLLSGGFDSAVAAFLMLKRGVELDYVFCNLAGEAYERSVVQVAKVLADRWSYGSRPRLFVVDFGPPVDEIRARSNPRYWQVVLKRLMYGAAERIASGTGALAVVTGEAIGQVSSQTLHNLAAIDGASALPVIRPLVGFDKGEIIETSRRVGNFEISSGVKEYCAIAPGNPVTHATPRSAQAEEAKLDPAVLRRAVEATREIDLRALSAADLVESYLYIDQLPEGAVVVDVRGEQEWEAWHRPGAIRLEPWEIAGRLKEFDPERTYVLYCDVGMQAAFAAEQMQRAGLEAYAFRGGTRALRERTGAAHPA